MNDNTAANTIDGHMPAHLPRLAPPERIVVRGLFGARELTHAECEAWHLRRAAKLVGSPFAQTRKEQEMHLIEAERHRYADLRNSVHVGMPRGT